MLNQMTCIGRLTRDPELRYTPQGVPVATFSVAVDRPFTNQQGQRETDFIDIVAWRKLAETVGNHLHKGRLVAVAGRLQVRSYEAQDGSKRKVTEVIADTVNFLDRPREAGASAETPSAAPEELVEFPDDLPF